MTSSSSSSRSGVRPAGPAAPKRWEWTDLGASAPAAAAPVTPEELAARTADERKREIERAFREGYERGVAEGETRARVPLEEALRVVNAALDEIRDRHERWRTDLADNLHVLALAVARHIVDRELAADPEIFADLVRTALAAFPLDHSVRIRLHPRDLALISAVSDGESDGPHVTGGREARWIPDPSLAPGGCVVEGPDRILDGRVDACLERAFWELRSGE